MDNQRYMFSGQCSVANRSLFSRSNVHHSVVRGIYDTCEGRNGNNETIVNRTTVNVRRGGLR